MYIFAAVACFSMMTSTAWLRAAIDLFESEKERRMEGENMSDDTTSEALKGKRG